MNRIETWQKSHNLGFSVLRNKIQTLNLSTKSFKVKPNQQLLIKLINICQTKMFKTISGGKLSKHFCTIKAVFTNVSTI